MTFVVNNMVANDKCNTAKCTITGLEERKTINLITEFSPTVTKRRNEKTAFAKN